MSYSFTVRAATKAEAKEKVQAAFSGVVKQQVTHEADHFAAVAAAEAFIDILADPEENDEVLVNMNGSLSWSSENVYTVAAVTINASVRNKV
jgi:hypothetical protein